jgi:ATP phosphoribosyltransferase regulatory subunit
VLRRARKLPWPAPVRRAIDTVEMVLALTREVVASGFHATITLDLGEIRGFEYYTGIRFAGYADGVGEPVLHGGRYDELMGCYGHPAQATGFAVDIEAIAQAQQTREVALPAAVTAILVATSKPRRQEGMRVAAALRAQGLRAAVDLGQRRGRRGLAAYASEVGFTCVLSLDASSAQACRVDSASGEPGAGAAWTEKWIDVAPASVVSAAAGDGKALAALLAAGQARAAARPGRVAGRERRA